MRTDDASFQNITNYLFSFLALPKFPFLAQYQRKERSDLISRRVKIIELQLGKILWVIWHPSKCSICSGIVSTLMPQRLAIGEGILG
jgi:hypothetical protein